MAGSLPPVYRREVVGQVFGSKVLPPGANPALVFNRYLRIWDGAVSRGVLRAGEKGNRDSGRQAALREFVTAYAALENGEAHRALKEVDARLAGVVKAKDGRCVELNTAWRLVSGLGQHHPNENGFAFDRNVGVPYLPGTGVKGVCHALAGLADPASLPQARIDEIFGFGPEEGDGGSADRAASGDLVFLPAYPAPNRWPRLELDIVNSHHSEYQAGLEAFYQRPRRSPPVPIDYESPNPVFFLAVAADTPFRFRVFSRTGSARNLDCAVELLETALTLLGIGAKTAVGYGRFRTKEAEGTADPLQPPPPEFATHGGKIVRTEGPSRLVIAIDGEKSTRRVSVHTDVLPVSAWGRYGGATFRPGRPIVVELQGDLVRRILPADAPNGGVR
jgi:CRISPR-associated protein Cmr6